MRNTSNSLTCGGLLILLSISVVSASLILPAHKAAASSGPSILDRKIASATSVTLANGATSYFYAATIGGSFDLTPVDFTQDASATNNENYRSVIIGHSISSTGSFSDQGALYPTIGGIGVQGGSYNMPPTICPGVNSASILSCKFTLSESSLVVIVAAASNTLPTPSVQISSSTGDVNYPEDLVSSASPGGTIVLADNQLPPGTYTLTITFHAWNDEGARASAAVLYEFPVSAATTLLSISDIKFQSASSFVEVWVNLDYHFPSAFDATDYVKAVSKNNQPEPLDFGSIPFSLNITNSGLITATNVVVTVTFNYNLQYKNCPFVVPVVCSGLDLVQISDSKTYAMPDIPPGDRLPLNNVFEIRYATVIVELLGIAPTAVIIADPITGSVATTESITVSGSDAPPVSENVPFSIGGLNTADVGVGVIEDMVIVRACIYLDGEADFACHILSDLGKSIGEEIISAVQHAIITDGQTVEYPIEVNSGQAVEVFTLIYPGSEISLQAVDPQGSIYQGVSSQGLSQIRIQNPIAGAWKLKVTGIDMPTAGENFTLSKISASKPTNTTTPEFPTAALGLLFAFVLAIPVLLLRTRFRAPKLVVSDTHSVEVN